MAIETPAWTRDDLERFPSDGNRYEVLDGELLVTPQAGFDHQIFTTRLIMALGAFVAEHGVGVVVGPGAVIFGKSELQPDVMVLRNAPTVRLGGKWENMPVPLLAVEVLSPSALSRRHDLDLKRQAYTRIGIETYWVVDPRDRCVHVWSSKAERAVVVMDTLRWHPTTAAAPFEVEVAALLGPLE